MVLRLRAAGMDSGSISSACHVVVCCISIPEKFRGVIDQGTVESKVKREDSAADQPALLRSASL